MDIPRQRPQPTWRDTPWWQATRQAAISAALMVVVATPLVAWLGASLLQLSHQPLDACLMASELGKGSLAMLPYLWVYYFALERIARQRRDNQGY